MGFLGVIKAEPVSGHPSCRKTIFQFMQIDGLVFQASPKALDKNVVHVATSAIHGDTDVVVLQQAGQILAGELTSLVRIENLRLGVGLSGLFQSLRGIQAIGQVP